MESLLGFKLDFWDYATFAALAGCILTGLIFVIWLAGLPARIANLQYKAGAIDFLSVLQLQNDQIGSEANLIKLRNAQLANRINLHLALGGSFNTAQPTLTNASSNSILEHEYTRGPD